MRTLFFIENWFNNKTQEKEPVIVCYEGDLILGYATFGRFRPRAAYQFSAEHSVYVKTGSHRQGIGSLLLGRLFDLAQK
ncbi:MAG: GNAT family N-acetyltransferase [Saprospiraceae bacterium]|nr:GNAT family N-acetyltransferase [Saprospiraceae bacterium]